jgi:RNase P/RNase MRP subunit POP5
LRKAMIEVERSESERRAFIYFDIISWLDSKLTGRRVEEIIQKKNLQHGNHLVKRKP